MKLKTISTICILTSSVMLSGCVHGDGIASIENMSDAISQEAILYSQARKNATNGIIFSNILEARDRGIMGHNTVTGVQSSPTSSSNLTTTFNPLGLGNPSGPLQASTGGVTRAAGRSGSFSVNPVASGLDEGSGVLYKPIPNSVFKDYWRGGWPKDLVLSLLVESYEVHEVDNITGKIKTKVERNGGKKPYEILAYLDNHFMSLNNIVLSNPVEAPKPPKIYLIEQEIKAKGKDIDRAVEDDEIRKLTDERKLLQKKLRLAKATETEDKNCQPINRRDFLELSAAFTNGDDTSDNILKALSSLYKGELRITADGRYLVCEKAKTSKKLYLFHQDKVSGVKAVEITLKSFDEAVYFAGETMRKDVPEYLYRRSGDIKTIRYNNLKDKIRMLETTTSGNKRDFATWTEHRGRRFYTGRRLGLDGSEKDNDRSQTVITMLRHILELNQSKAFLKAPENQFLVR